MTILLLLCDARRCAQLEFQERRPSSTFVLAVRHAMEFTIPGQSKGTLTPTKSAPLPRVTRENEQQVVKSTPIPAASPQSSDAFLIEPETKKKGELARRQDEFRRLMNLPEDNLLEGALLLVR